MCVNESFVHISQAISALYQESIKAYVSQQHSPGCEGGSLGKRPRLRAPQPKFMHDSYVLQNLP